MLDASRVAFLLVAVACVGRAGNVGGAADSGVALDGGSSVDAAGAGIIGDWSHADAIALPAEHRFPHVGFDSTTWDGGYQSRL